MADSLKKKATVATYWRIDVRISPLKYPVAPHAQKETFLSGELLRLTATVFRTQYVRNKRRETRTQWANTSSLARSR